MHFVLNGDEILYSIKTKRLYFIQHNYVFPYVQLYEFHVFSNEGFNVQNPTVTYLLRIFVQAVLTKQSSQAILDTSPWRQVRSRCWE
jgi:hypothetical protein